MQQYLNQTNQKTKFKDNLPGADWYSLFKEQHSDRLTEIVAQNVHRAQAKSTTAAVED